MFLKFLPHVLIKYNIFLWYDRRHISSLSSSYERPSFWSILFINIILYYSYSQFSHCHLLPFSCLRCLKYFDLHYL